MNRSVVESRLRAAADELRAWNGVAVIGAGVSLVAGLPLLQHLDPLLWQAIDADADARAHLAKRLGRGIMPAKSLIGDDESSRRAAFEIVSEGARAREVFQQGFSRLDRERARQPSRAHDALARLLHRRHLEIVISLNWDTLLEAAYRRLYGSILQEDRSWLWKLHGDASHPEQRWIFPHEPGYVPPELIAHLGSLTEDRPRTLLIAGYSERDEAIVRQLIAPLAGRWRVVRIGPRVSGEADIPLPADEALPELLRSVSPGPEVPGWEYVSFEPHDDLRPALLGRRLGPAEVEACPRLPEAHEVKRLLDLAHGAMLVGDSGSGKSITAYQAAYDLSRNGFEVLRLVDLEGEPDEILGSLVSLPRPTVALVDDAQAVDSRLIRRLLERATARLKVLIVSTTDYSFQRGSLKLDVKRAVAVLAESLAKRRQETLEIVRELDDRVGDAYLDERLEHRLAEAAKSENPWQFSFVLTGGWRRAREILSRLRQLDRADLLLAAVAVHQILSQDAGATMDQLRASARLLGRDPEWMDRALDVLQHERVILGQERLRCPHARFAEVVLRIVCDTAPRDEMQTFIAFLRTAMVSKDPPLLGLFRLVQELRFTDRFNWNRHGTVVDDEVLRRLAERCWAASTGEERGAAAPLLSELRGWHPDCLTEIEAHAPLLGLWLEEAEPEAARGLEWLLNSLSQEAKPVSTAICDHADPHRVADRMATANLKDGYIWGELLRVLSVAASPEWVERLRQTLPIDIFLGLARKARSGELFYVVALAKGLMSFRQEASLAMIELIVPQVAAALNTDPAGTFADLDDLFWWVLGYFPRFLHPRTPSPEQRKIARAIARRVNPEQVGRALSRTSRRNIPNFARLLDFLWEVAPSKARAIAGKVEIDAFSKSTRGIWNRPDNDLEHLLGTLARSADHQPARTIIERHASELQRLTPTLTIIAPHTAVERLQAGLKLDLEVSSGFHWGRAVAAIYWIWKTNPDLAVEVVRQNADTISSGLELRQSNQCEDLDLFIQAVHEVAPEELSAILSGLNPGMAEANWSARLRGSPVERRSVAVLLAAASLGNGALAEVARKLQRRFPSTLRLGRLTGFAFRGC